MSTKENITKENIKVKATQSLKEGKSTLKNLTVEMVSQTGTPSGMLELSGGVFGRKIKASSVHASVVYTRNKARAGTHSTITKGEMIGGAKKPWKQKGTGRARAGSSTSPIWVGGAVAHGPHPRSYEISMNKKEKVIALSAVLSDKLSAGLLKVVAGEGSGFVFANCKTKEAIASLGSLGISGEKTLVVFEKNDDKAQRAFRNIPGVKVISADAVNAFELLKYNFVVCSQAGIQKIQTRVESVLG